MNVYCVIEVNDDYIFCHASGLSWADAHLLILCKMLDDGGKFKNVSMYELECNEPGLGVECEIDGRKTTYYILDDPGRNIFKDVYELKEE